MPLSTPSARHLLHDRLFYGHLNVMLHHISTTKTTHSTPLKNTHSFHPRLRAVMSQLDMIAPRFVLNKGDVEIITSPVEFYERLKLKIAHAEKRVFLSSLYIGKTQHELVATITDALRAKPELRVYILTDALRGTREAPQHSSASLLSPLTEEFGNRVDIRMYHTPHLNGVKKSLLPVRINEGWGLQHMKMYGFDDEIIMSGANLSSDYFTDRQDRYYHFKSQTLTDYYFSIQQAVSSLSYRIYASASESKFRMSWPTSNASSEPHLNMQRFLSDALLLLEPLLKPRNLAPFEDKDEGSPTTVVYPVSQFTPLLVPDHSTEKPAVLRLLSLLDSPKIQWTFTAGYFNMHPEIKKRLINSRAIGNVITAAPKANGFYKSGGISYYLPEAYLLLSKKFLVDVHANQKEATISLNEWQRGIVNTPNGWSYHAKGLWISVPDETRPSVTMIGSSNYTRRAYSLDLESNAIVVTKDEELKAQMANEVENLMLHTKRVTLEDFEKDEERQISQWVQVATKLVGRKL
ncbi:hypothetical protein BABINDRAFT_180990 [Babjeviella inositovora NRRL Y-12698]|uniref:CDP-diacylglycerol--glycerol-3-phosphate 3-phosphatidyltransferase n=1 Tax=Babjeviella inositovora NRRL Y-12698 TaxID=984486 RepID=A0A1E3QM96_9ASCO|nr:uncharacterized protein BABINDRAFT_180990 [Babjeviella inositovora NRRL Y-12698]ODQ78805.1 hypothetical protein BABINDRAFT_180990 [Babjeviella inositovora NRRL Y-12698]